ncbi:MAG TPA: hypothetical protein VES88_12530 [Gemmatimonadaceae bacterium]|nr:hypothetical protein [Gemmatimonadaceae bacterium]
MTALLSEGFVIEDQCNFTFLPSVILLQGTIVCLDGLTLEVEKDCYTRGRGLTALVQTRRFRYHAWIRGRHNVFRYESAHEHRPHAHKHVYASFGNGTEIEVIDLTNERLIPTLGEVIRELQSWHAKHAAQISELR